MQKKEDLIKWFSELSNKDVLIAGGKGASLAEMYNAKVPVPPGFVVTAQAYSYFFSKTGLDKQVSYILNGIDVNNTAQLENASKTIRAMIEKTKMPSDLEDEIIEAYQILDSEQSERATALLKKGRGVFVAVRSSATTEDLADASFAGQQDSYLNVRGEKELIESVRKCVSSLFTARAIYYRAKKGFAHDKARLAVVVQVMVNSEKSGVMFSRNPTKEENTIVIEAVWGLGEGIVSGKIKPDHYVVDGNLESFDLMRADISKKKTAIVRGDEGSTETITLDEEKAERRVLDNYELKRLAFYAKQLEEHYGIPQDIEFAIDSRGIYIVQSRPITTKPREEREKIKGIALLNGLGASPGVASGKVKIVHSLKDLELVKEGDVLVTEMTNPDMVVTMQRAAAIITDEGGVTSHAAIVSREMGIPAVVGTGNATEKLKEGMFVTVDGSNGAVFEGKGETHLKSVEPIFPTRTQIKVIIDLPDFAERAALSRARSVGLLRLEGIIAIGGKHPLWFVKQKKIKEYIALLSEGIKKIAEPFEEVWIRTSDIRSDEYVNLTGAPDLKEQNPMLGDHGVRFSIKHPDIMRAELFAIKEVADDFPHKKFGVMTPQVISVEEIIATKKIAHEVGMPKNVVVGIMVETPAAVQIIEDLCAEGIAFASFGTNDLTQYTLAIDRNNENVQNLYNEMHPAVLNSLKHVISVCRRYNVKTSICGQAGSKPEMAAFLVRAGIDSISVNADAARAVSETVSKIEQEFSTGDETKKNIYAEEEHNKKPANARKNDIEEEILRELGENEEVHEINYNPGFPRPTRGEIPSLNESFGEALGAEEYSNNIFDKVFGRG